MADDMLEHSITCSECGALYTSDMTEEELQELGLRRLCESCRQQKFGEALSQDVRDDVREFLEEFYGLTTDDKETIKALVSLVQNHDRAIMVANAMTRVDNLEQKLENKTAALESKLEGKLDNMESRLWVSSVALDVALFVGGVLAGIVGTLLLGG